MGWKSHAHGSAHAQRNRRRPLQVQRACSGFLKPTELRRAVPVMIPPRGCTVSLEEGGPAACRSGPEQQPCVANPSMPSGPESPESCPLRSSGPSAVRTEHGQHRI